MDFVTKIPLPPGKIGKKLSKDYQMQKLSNFIGL